MKLIFYGRVILLSAVSFLTSMDNNSFLPELQGKVYEGMRETKNKKKFAEYRCSRCDITPKLRNNIMKHMHNKCFPIKGLPCVECIKIDPQSTDAKFTTFKQILEHNVQHHAHLKKWECLVCGAGVKKINFYKHFTTNTYYSNAFLRIGGYSESQFEQMLNALPVRQATTVAQNSITVVEAPSLPINTTPSPNTIEWVYYKPMLINGKAQLVRTNTIDEQIIQK